MENTTLTTETVDDLHMLNEDCLNALIIIFWPISSLSFYIQNYFSSFTSHTGGFGVEAGGSDILAFCQQAVWQTASLERKWKAPRRHAFAPLCSFLRVGQRTIWAGLLEWEVFSCQMLNRLCSLHLAQEHRDIHAHKTHTYAASILADIIPLSESLAENQRWLMSGVWLCWRPKVSDCDLGTKNALPKVKHQIIPSGRHGVGFKMPSIT